MEAEFKATVMGTTAKPLLPNGMEELQCIGNSMREWTKLVTH